jgi:hypothetical protein
MYQLIRTSDLAGDSGSMSVSLGVKHTRDAEPTVGECIKVGSPVPRSFYDQDYWMTNPVAEIVERVIENNKLKIVFKTESGSEYIWYKY